MFLHFSADVGLKLFVILRYFIMSNLYKTFSTENKSYEEQVNSVQIFKLDEGNKIVLLKDEVEQLLRNDVIKNRKVCVISVAGIFRQGKSFLLNFFLTFLKKKIQIIEKWIDLDDKLIFGFSWKTTSERITEGILIWPEIFVTKTESDEEIAVILIDTQGTSDHTTSGTQSASLFALSVLISSVQIYNVKNNLSTDHLKNLQVFTGYGSTHCDTSNKKPFQKLVILVRDWEYPFEYHYGFEGGKNLLANVFRKHNESQQEELTTIQETIEENFDQVDCFLMPHPGKEVATNQNFEGHFDCIDEEFLTCMETFVETVLAPDNLVPKEINGEFVTVEGLFELITMYANHFKEGKQLNIKTIYAATAEAYHQECLNKAIKDYSACMQQCDSFLKADEEKRKIFQNFEKKVSKMGTKELIEFTKRRLSETLETVFENHRIRFEENGLRSFCKQVFSYITGGTTVSVAAVEVATVVTAAEVTTVSALLESAIAGGIVGLGGGAILGGGIGLAVLGLGKCAIFLKNSEKTKKFVSYASVNVKNVYESGCSTVGATFRKWVKFRSDEGSKRAIKYMDGDGLGLKEKTEAVEVNGDGGGICFNGNAAKCSEFKQNNEESFDYISQLVIPLLVVIFVVFYFTFATV